MKIKRFWMLLLLCFLTIGLVGCLDTPDAPSEGEGEQTDPKDQGDTENEYSSWVSNGDGTHTRSLLSDPSKTETKRCGGASGKCTGSYVCPSCGGTYIDHTFHKTVKDEYLLSAATCSSAAVYRMSCTCGAVSENTFVNGEPIAHQYDQEKSEEKYFASAATCTAPAKYYKSCVCGIAGTETFTVGEPLAHTFDRKKTEIRCLVSPATCCAKAVYYYSCVCGAIGTETFEGDHLGTHNFGDWTYNGDGTHTRVCKADATHTEKASCSGGYATETKGAVCSDCKAEYTEPKKVIRVLSIGNSYSIDGMEYLYDMLYAAGYQEIHLGCLYVGGCSLDMHANNAANDAAAYTYYQNDGTANENDAFSKWPRTANYKMSDALKAQAWDYVVFQQNSGNSGKANTFEPALTKLLTYVKGIVPEKTKFLWHMTWAAASNGSLGSYGGSQMQMYNEICSAVTSGIAGNTAFSGVIPVGTAIQNARTSVIGDNLCRDTNSHLTYTLGRYTAALTWCAFLTGCDVSKLNVTLTYPGITDDMIAIGKESVINAMKNPLAVTQSKFTGPIDESDLALAKSAGYDLTGYRLYSWHSNANSYWNSTALGTMIVETTPGGGQYGKFVCSDKISIGTLPAGTIFVLDAGWQLRIEKYENATDKYNGSRPGNSTARVQELKASFLTDAGYITFNLSRTDGTQITDFAEAATHLRVYVKN